MPWLRRLQHELTSRAAAKSRRAELLEQLVDEMDRHAHLLASIAKEIERYAHGLAEYRNQADWLRSFSQTQEHSGARLAPTSRGAPVPHESGRSPSAGAAAAVGGEKRPAERLDTFGS